MSDTTVIKVNSRTSPHGPSGLTYLAAGKNIAMRIWDEASSEKKQQATSRDYETAGYVIEGSAELEIEGQTIQLEAGDSWIVPKGASHRYRILQQFKAVEATHPPFHLHGRDQ